MKIIFPKIELITSHSDNIDRYNEYDVEICFCDGVVASVYISCLPPVMFYNHHNNTVIQNLITKAEAMYKVSLK